MNHAKLHKLPRWQVASAASDQFGGGDGGKIGGNSGGGGGGRGDDGDADDDEILDLAQVSGLARCTFPGIMDQQRVP